MHPSKIILLLLHLLFSVPAESNPLLHPSQFLKTGYPEDVQMQRNMPGIVSYGSVFIGSMNNGVQITEHGHGPENEFAKGMNSKEGCQQPQNPNEPFHGVANPLLSGSLATAGLSSTELFLAQAMEIAKAKEKENAGHFPFTTDIIQSEGKDKTITSVKLPNRPKTTIPMGAQSEAISFVVSEPFQTSGKTPGNTSVTHSHCGQLGMENSEHKVLPMISSPGVQENILFSKVIQPIIMPHQTTTDGPQQKTTAMQQQTDMAYTPTTTTGDYTAYSPTTTTSTNDVSSSTTTTAATTPTNDVSYSTATTAATTPTNVSYSTTTAATTPTNDVSYSTATTAATTPTNDVSYSTTTTAATTPTNGQVAYSTTKGQVTGPAVSTSTIESRNLRSAVTSKSFKLRTTQTAEQGTELIYAV